jgi:hypothetical protein
MIVMSVLLIFLDVQLSRATTCYNLNAVQASPAEPQRETAAAAQVPRSLPLSSRGTCHTADCTAHSHVHDGTDDGAHAGTAATPAQLLLSYLQQMGLACAAAQLMVAPWLPVLARHWGYAFCSCCFLGGVMDLLGALAVGLYGVHIAPSFNKPWLVGAPLAGVALSWQRPPAAALASLL